PTAVVTLAITRCTYRIAIGRCASATNPSPAAAWTSAQTGFTYSAKAAAYLTRRSRSRAPAHTSPSATDASSARPTAYSAQASAYSSSRNTYVAQLNAYRVKRSASAFVVDAHQALAHVYLTAS